MTIEHRLHSHYLGIADDPLAEEQLRSLIGSLGAPDRRSPRGPRVAAALAAAVVAVVGCAALVAVLVPGGSDETPTPPQPPNIGSSPARTTHPTMVKNPPGWSAVVAHVPHGFRDGWARNSELYGDPQPTSPAQALAAQRLRGEGGAAVIPAYAEPRDGSAVIGWFTIGSGTLRSTCPGDRGRAFTQTPPADAVGARTPLAAARSIRTRYLIGNYGSAASPWRTTTTSATAATVTAGSTTLHLRRQGNGTWVIVGGQRCLG